MERDKVGHVDVFVLYLEDMNRSKRLTPEEEKELREKAASGDGKTGKRVYQVEPEACIDDVTEVRPLWITIV